MKRRRTDAGETDHSAHSLTSDDANDQVRGAG